MIILRQKEFGHVRGHGIKALVSKGINVADNVGNSKVAVKFRKAVTPSELGRKRIEDTVRANRRSSGNRQHLREGIETVNSSKKTLETASNYMNTHTPGQIVADIPQVVMDNGIIATGGTIAGYIPLAFGKYFPGTTAAAVAAEGAVRKAIPGYAIVSTAAANTYKGSKLKRGITSTLDTANQVLKFA